MRRCLLVPFALLLLAGSAPLAQAQLLPAFSLSASPSTASVYPGDVATFHVTVGNSAEISRAATLTATNLPAEWNASFANATLVVPARGSNATTLSVQVSAAQAPAGPFPIVIEVRDDFGVSTRANVSVSVKPRPEPTPAPTPAPPTLSLAISSGDAGLSGETVEGLLTLSHADAARATLSVELSIAGDAAWSPTLEPADRFRILDRDRAVSIPLYATVPQLAENTTATFTVTAKAEGYSFTAAWTVAGHALPQPAGDSASAGGATSSATSTTPTRAAPTPALEVLVAPIEIPIGPGETADGVFTLRNTGPLPLTLALQAAAPVTWPAVAWEANAVEIQPGGIRDVRFTLTAPEGLPLGGEATGQVSASGNGVVRTAQFHVRIVAPSAPRQETEAARIEVPSAPDGALPVAGVPVGLVLGLGTVGAGAAALAHRPTREKLLWLGVGLYTRLARPDVLGHEERERLYKLVETQPGIHFHALQRDLAWNTGTLTYHLRVLERHGFLVSRRDGLYRRFYLSGAAPRKEVFENAGPTGLRADVLEAVKNTPGISQSDLALALSANKQTVNYHVKALERSGTIRVEKRGRDTYLYPASHPAQGPGFAQA